MSTPFILFNNFLRGHLFFVTSGGFIRYWAPLYKSEGTAQVSFGAVRQRTPKY